jgi:protein-disulfide isomerase
MLLRCCLPVLALLLAACGASQPAQVATSASPTAAPTSPPALPSITPLPTATSTSIPATATPLPPSPVPPSPTATPQAGLDEEPHATLGTPDAPITIYEFSDFGCPSCRQFALFTFPTLKEQYIDTGKVRLIYKDFPIVSQHGGLAAQAAECAGEQGYYWEMHDQLFANPAEWNASPAAALEAFRRYAQAYGMDAEALVACVAEERYKPEVDRDFEEGQELRLFGTPTFIINRLLLSGAQPPEVFAEVIDNLLAEQEGE